MKYYRLNDSMSLLDGYIVYKVPDQTLRSRSLTVVAPATYEGTKAVMEFYSWDCADNFVVVNNRLDILNL